MLVMEVTQEAPEEFDISRFLRHDPPQKNTPTIYALYLLNKTMILIVSAKVCVAHGVC